MSCFKADKIFVNLCVKEEKGREGIFNIEKKDPFLYKYLYFLLIVQYNKNIEKIAIDREGEILRNIYIFIYRVCLFR